MPLYEYSCKACAHQFELLVRTGEIPECPACRAQELERRFSVFAAHSAGPRTPGAAPRAAAPRPAGPGSCGSCGDPRGPGSCSMN